jgi:integrase
MSDKPKRRVSVKGHPGVYWHPVAGGRRYEISYVDSDGKRRWETVAGNLKDAEAVREGKRELMRKNERVAPTRKTIAEVADEWLASQTELRPRTIERYELALRVHIVKRVGRMRVAELTVKDVSWLIAEMRKAGLAGWTIRGHLTPLSLMMDYAVAEGWVAANPVKKLKKGSRPRVNKQPPRILERDEIDRLLAAADPRYSLLFKTAVHTGLRYGELLGLTWADVNFEGRPYVHVQKQLGRDGVRVAPKTDKAVRKVPLMDTLVRELREHKARSAFSLPTHFVFCSERGTPLQQRNVTRRGLDPAIRRAGLDEDGKPRLTMHCLRHGYGSMRLAEGATLVWVSAKMGHSNVQVTASVYAHLFDGDEQDEAARARQEAAYGTAVETAAGDGWQTESVAEVPSVSEIGSASGQRRPVANATG